MTRKLRAKFIVIIMSIVTIMLCIIMSMLYIFTKKNLESDSVNMMKNIADRPFLPHLPNEMQGDMRLPYFTLQLGMRGNLIATGGGYYDLSDEDFLKNLIDATFSADAPVGVIAQYNLRFFRKNAAGNEIIVYSDISSELTALSNLLRNCIFIGVACFLAFLGISYLLAGWVVKPVDKRSEERRVGKECRY